MSQFTHVPSLPLESGAGLSASLKLLGQLAAAAFVAGVVFMSAQVMAYSPSADADCMPEICSNARLR
jgi:hypothetical protein